MQNSNFGSIIKESLKLISDLQNGITHTPFLECKFRKIFRLRRAMKENLQSHISSSYEWNQQHQGI